MSRAIPPMLFAVLTLSGCVADRAPKTHADAATEAACRRRANEIYNQQNRADIYRPMAPINTPFSSNYTPGISDRGLSDLYAQDKLVNDCIRNSGTGAERSGPETGPVAPERP